LGIIRASSRIRGSDERWLSVMGLDISCFYVG